MSAIDDRLIAANHPAFETMKEWHRVRSRFELIQKIRECVWACTGHKARALFAADPDLRSLAAGALRDLASEIESVGDQSPGKGKSP